MKALVLAAGKGTRMSGGDLPKAMLQVCRRPLLGYVLRALSFVPKADTTLVVGYKREAITSAFPEYRFAVQLEQLGTGHAVMAAADVFTAYKGQLLVCYGDMPLVRQETYRALVSAHADEHNACTLLSGLSSGDEEVKAGIYVFDSQALFGALQKLGRANVHNEYYLADVPEIIACEGGRVGIYKSTLGDELLGVNTREQLELAEYRIREAGLIY